MDKNEHGRLICPSCRLEPETPEEKLTLAIYGYCVDCVPEEKLIQVNDRMKKIVH